MLSPRRPWREIVLLSSGWHSTIVARRLSSPVTLARHFIHFDIIKLSPHHRPIVSSLSSRFGSWSGEQDVKFSLQDATLQPQTPTQTAQSVGMMNNISEQEKEILFLLQFNPLVEGKPFPKNEGIIMGSDFAKQVISCMETPADNAIKGVPIDERESCRLKLIDSLSRPDDCKGVLLLCNCGSRGSGKSTLQAMNMKWFVNNTHGIAIYLTYDEDQSINLETGNSCASNGYEFEQTVALRILHRLMTYHLGDVNMANKLFDDRRIANAMEGLSDPILSALNIVKEMLGAPPDTKILLCVDEINMAVDDKAYDTQDALRVLCKRYLNYYPWLFLSVSVDGAIRLADYATELHCNVLLQHIPPIDLTLGFDESKIRLLPVMLQPFYDAKMRKLLPRTRTKQKNIDPLVLYSKMPQWMISTGCHGSRIEYLFEELRNFSVQGSLNSSEHYPWIESEEEGEAFVEQLWQWLDTYKEDTILTAMRKGSDALGGLKPYPVRNIDSLAEYAVRPFIFKNDIDAVKIILNAVESGICSLVEPGMFSDALAFIPAPVLQSLFGANFEVYDPCSQALYQLSEELHRLRIARTDNDREKCYERVMSRALLHCTRGNYSFYPRAFCLDEHAGNAFNEELLGGSVVYNDIAAFPPKGCRKLTNAQVEEFICHNLPSDANGAIVVPNKETFNPVGDYVYGIFRCSGPAFINNPSDGNVETLPGIIVLVFQNKYWFGDWSKDNDKPIHIIDSWQPFREIFPKEPITVKDNDGHQTVVEFLHILQTANPIDVKAYNQRFNKEFKCADNEGIGNLARMRGWHPTAAYACETAMTMNKLFGSYSIDTETK